MVFMLLTISNNLQFIITLPKATDIMIAQSGQSVGGYTLENLELEYELENQDLTSNVVSEYETGRSLSYEHVTLMKTTEWNKDSTTVNETMNLPRKSIKAIMLLFRNKTITDSEQFVYPNIESVKATIEGITNSVYSQGILKSRFFEEPNRVVKYNEEKNMTLQDFFKTINDNFVYGNGIKLVNTRSGLLLEIKKTATTANVICKIYVLSDGLLNIVNKDLMSIQY